MKGYKVVRKDCNMASDKEVLQSATSCGRVLTYILEKPIRPLKYDGPLAVFENREDAQDFIDGGITDNEGLVIFPCDYEPSEKAALFICNDEHNCLDLRAIDDCPVGTILADSVTLHEK
jgi:hypothetical protein